MPWRENLSRLVMGTLVMALSGPAANAAIVTVVAQGTVIAADNSSGLLPFIPVVGTPTTLALTISDTAPADSLGGLSTFGQYSGVIQSLTLTVGSTTIAMTPPAQSLVEIMNNHNVYAGTLSDRWRASAETGFQNGINQSVNLFLMATASPAPSVFTSDAYVAAPPALAMFNDSLNTRISLDFRDSQYGWDIITSNITSLEVTSVPLPAAAWLLLSGIGGLGLFGRRIGRESKGG